MIGTILNAYFKDLVKEKEYNGVRAVICSLIRNDPTFSSGKFEEVDKYLKKNGFQDIYQPYEKVPGEPPNKDKSEWDEKYFSSIAYAFRENFSYERLNYVKEVGKYVYHDKLTSGKEEALKKNIINRINKELNIDISKKFRSPIENGDDKYIIKNKVINSIKKII